LQGATPDQAAKQMADLHDELSKTKLRLQKLESPPPQRRLTETEKTSLRYQISKIRDQFPHGVFVVFAFRDPYSESIIYGEEFTKLLAELHIQVGAQKIKDEYFPYVVDSYDPLLKGIYIGVENPENPPKTAKVFYVALWNSGIYANFANQPPAPIYIGVDGFSLIIASSP
jgi:hypothetical protein